MKTSSTFQRILSVILLLWTFQAKAQYSGHTNIDANNINATLSCLGDHFTDHRDSLPKAEFLVPKLDSLSTIFTSAFWIGGLENNHLRISAQTYRQNGSDFWPGPLDPITGIDTVTMMKWDTMWKITKAEVEQFKQNSSNITNAIKNWPAKGNMGISKDMAPFFDADNNGSFDPSSGDYPLVKGDQMVWWVFNDYPSHTETNGIGLGVEIQAMAYAFNLPSDTALHNTLFFEYRIINRSTNDYDSVFLGIFTDFDLGEPFDDYVGSDSAFNTCYAYNGDNNDSGARGYGVNPPVQSLTFLNRPMNSFIAYNNDFSVTGNPTQPVHYYKYMSSIWLDGQHMTYGYNGRTGSTLARHMYSGDPVTSTGWTEQGNKPGDRKGLASTIVGALNSGDEVDFHFSYTYTRRSGADNIGNIKPMRKDVKHVIDQYKNNFPAEIAENRQADKLKILIYPNPAEGTVRISSEESLLNIKLTDLAGKEVLAEKAIGTIHELDVSNIKGGIYLLQIQTGKGFQTRKLVVNRP